ncbi:hypothetical protein [Aeromicrobium sp. IC_218]|uniref:hypothetical protein n=1 Tax=Aeromicrobium sp. IC_218 TaxID=2545468 RepID=UPI00103AE609|nr:hypothetical protein [Aeromicrobium sp. IC_218]TCI99776.1 hypothetical protein E0W78_05045 [Aeromicrobium sp. IC_218]
MRRRPVASLLVLAVLLGALGGAVWAGLADPARLEVRDQGIVLTESAATAAIDVVVLYLGVGVVLCAPLGVLVARRVPGPRGVAVTIIASLVAAAVAYAVGRVLGPPDAATLTGLAAGDTVPQQLGIGNVVPTVVWAAAGLVGLLAATAVGDREPETAPEVPVPR